MGLKQLIRKLVSENETERKLQDPEKDKKKLVRVDPLERIAALKAADLDLSIQLNRTSGASAGVVSKQWHKTLTTTARYLHPDMTTVAAMVEEL